jgi:hypothetical protein
MWRPFLFQGPRHVGCMRGLEALRERIESCTQRRYLLLLPIDDIAELDVGALQERYFCLDPLDCIAVHFDSVTNASCAEAPFACSPTTKTKLEISLYRQYAGRHVPKRRLCRNFHVKCLFL